MRRRKFAILILALLLPLALVTWQFLAPRAPDHATAQTLFEDVRRARDESRGDPHRYAYRLYHYALDAFPPGTRWKLFKKETAHIDLIDDQPDSLTFTVPGAELKTEWGSFKPIFNFGRHIVHSPTAPSSDSALFMGVELLCTSERPFDSETLSTAWEPFSGKVAQRPGFIALGEKFPTVHQIVFTYTLVGTPSVTAKSGSGLTGQFTGMYTLRKGGLEDFEDVVVSYWSKSKMEPTAKRFVPFLPFTYQWSDATIGDIEADSDSESFPQVEAFRTFSFWSLERKANLKGQANWNSDQRVYSQPDLLAAPGSTTDLSVLPQYPVNLSALARFKNLKSLTLLGQDITESDVAYLAALPHLENLDLPVPSRSLLEKIGKLRLRTLSVDADTLFSPDFSCLRQLEDLEDLSLSISTFDAGLVATIRALPKLRKLSLYLRTNSHQNLTLLANLPNLTRLTLLDVRDPKRLQVIGSLRNLEVLRLYRCDVDHAVLRAIGGLSKLRRVEFNEVTGTNDAGILELANLGEIQSIDIAGSPGTTAAGVRALQSKLPGEFTGPFSEPED